MKAFGYDFSFGMKRATEIRGAESSRSAAKKGLEVGDSGTQILAGIISEEYNPKLRDTKGIDVYDEMRKSDGTVKAAMLALTLPIRRANWYVNPVSQDVQDVEIADFVEDCFFEHMNMSFDDFIRQALLCLPFGVMPFEKVFATREISGKTMFIWDKFAPRMPKSIYKWETEDHKPGIQQRRQDGNLVSIPMDKLIVFVNEKEGDNWWGTSSLRAAYKHWYIKNNFYKIDAIAFERQGLGVPYVKLPENYTETERAKAEEILKNLRAHDQAFIIEPFDYEIGFKDMMAHTLRDPSPSIQHHNREIAKSVLAHFLELGAGSTGSFALSQDQTELFLLSLEAVAHNLADTLKNDIKQLVDLNFEGVEMYPTLDFNGITRADVAKIASAYQTLTNSGGIQSGEQDEIYFRELMGLPEREVDEVPADAVDLPDGGVAEDDAMDEAGLAEASERIKKKEYPSRKEIRASLEATTRLLTAKAKTAHLERVARLIAGVKASEHRAFLKEVRLEIRGAMRRARVQEYAEGDQAPFKSFRKMTFAEKKVDFNSIQKMMDQLEEEMDAATQELLHAEREKYMKVISKAALSGDTKKIKDAQIEARAAYAKIIREKMKEAYEYGKTNASLEMKIKTPPNDKRVIDAIDVQADAIAQQHIAEISNEATIKYAGALNKGASVQVALAAADEAMNALIDELTSDTSQIVMAGQINRGRDTVFTAEDKKIYALQRSELLDSSTCNYCLSVDGRIIEKNDPFGKNTIFHSGCRGIWVEILTDEAELPDITGIPKTIKDRFGDEANDLIQPRNPQTRKDSLARKEVERRARRKAKA